MKGDIAQVADKNCQCPKRSSARKRSSYPLLLGLVVAILPKCPFCAFGYSAVMVLCSGAKVYDYSPQPQSFLPILLALAVAASLLWNFRDRRSWWALVLALSGSALIAWAQRITGDPKTYYLGVVFIFSAVFVNGHFVPFWRRISKVLFS